MSNPNMLTRITAPLALTGAILGGAACGGNGGETTLNSSTPEAATTTVPLSPEQQQEVGALCVNGFDMSISLEDEFAQDNVGGADSLMNNFTEENAEGQTVMVGPEIFADRILDEVCKKPTVLATITAFMIEPAGYGVNGKIAAPDSSSLARAAELAELYRNNEPAALEAIKAVASVVRADDGVEAVDDYSVIENQGVRIEPKRDEEGVATGLMTERITVGDLFEGYLFKYNVEDPSLTEKEIQDREAVSMLVLIDKNGEMIIRVWIGDQQVDIEIAEDAPETTAVETTIAESETTENVDTTVDEGDEETGTTVGTTPGTTPSGTTPTGTVPTGTTPSGTTPGTTPGTAPGTTTGTTPTTPAPTTAPPTTPAPTTAPPTTPAPTTTQPPRDVCPNIPGAQETVPPGQEIVYINGQPFCKDIPPATTNPANPAP